MILLTARLLHRSMLLTLGPPLCPKDSAERKKENNNKYIHIYIEMTRKMAQNETEALRNGR